MTVYVVTAGLHDEQSVVGVYASLETAQAANVMPGEAWRDEGDGQSWRVWSNHLDWGSHRWIEAFEVEG